MKKEWVEKILSSVLTNEDFAGMSDDELDRLLLEKWRDCWLMCS